MIHGVTGDILLSRAATIVQSVALPKLATGVGGLYWSEVKPLIEQRLGTQPIPVYVYATFHAGQQAKEPAVV